MRLEFGAVQNDGDVYAILMVYVLFTRVWTFDVLKNVYTYMMSSICADMYVHTYIHMRICMCTRGHLRLLVRWLLILVPLRCVPRGASGCCASFYSSARVGRSLQEIL